MNRDEAINVVRNNLPNSRYQFSEALKTLIPELNMSDDERIIQAIGYSIANSKHEDGTILNGVTEDEALSWLEKQGEQKPADKVEPKFKVGDWCIDNEDGTIFQIMKVLDNTYRYKTNEGKEYSCTHYSLENDAHLWTIQDAKDGDVLANNGNIILFKEISNSARKDYKYIKSHCLVLMHSFDFYTGGSYSLDDGFHPATKEQRDVLERAMTNAGYRWNKEELKLEKI